MSFYLSTSMIQYRYRHHLWQAWAVRFDRRQRRGAPFSRRVRHIHPDQPALLASGPQGHVRYVNCAIMQLCKGYIYV